MHGGALNPFVTVLLLSCSAAVQHPLRALSMSFLFAREHKGILTAFRRRL